MSNLARSGKSNYVEVKIRDQEAEERPMMKLEDVAALNLREIPGGSISI